MVYNRKKQLSSFHLFAGAGGGILADEILGHYPIGACEIEKFPREILLQRQHEKAIPKFPIWDDVRTLKGREWAGTVDILAGGFPCQDISSAGKGAGITGARSGLWCEFARLIEEMQPSYVFIENAPYLKRRGLRRVLADLARLGFDARWGILGAWAVGAPHRRDRIWIFGYKKNQKQRTANNKKSPILADSSIFKCNYHTPTWRDTTKNNKKKQTVTTTERCGLWWQHEPKRIFENTRKPAEMAQMVQGEDTTSIEPLLGRVADGVADRVDRIHALGNGQVPQVAALAFSILSHGII